MITLTYRTEHLQVTGGLVVMVWSISTERGQFGAGASEERSSVSIFDLLGGAS